MSTLDPLLAEALAATAAGDLPTAAACFARAADQLAPTHPADAALALESLVRVRLLAGELDAARAAYARLGGLAAPSDRTHLLGAEVGDADPDPAVRRAGWEALVARATSPALRRRGLLQLAALARQVGDPHAALAALDAAVAALGDDAGPAERGEVRLERAAVRTMLHELAAAGEDLDAAEAAAGELPDSDLPARLRGQRGVVALAAGDEALALAHAEAARAAAVARADAATYLAASALVALVHEQAGRLVAAYDAYARAKASLGDLLGDQGRAMVAPAIALFEERLGPAAFQQVWDAWVAARRAAPP